MTVNIETELRNARYATDRAVMMRKTAQRRNAALRSERDELKRTVQDLRERLAEAGLETDAAESRTPLSDE
jgi:uncharacterized coiled-coil DUF342 family protein